jgi:hypothetical protein
MGNFAAIGIAVRRGKERTDFSVSAGFPTPRETAGDIFPSRLFLSCRRREITV